MKTNTIRKSVSMDAALAARIEALAAKDGRKFSNFVNIALRRHFGKKSGTKKGSAL